MCTNQNVSNMKTTLLVVGRTVEQHFITAINDYVQRTKRYLSFEMEVIPELKNTKSLSMEVQKEKEGELICKAFQPGDVIVLLDEGGKEMRSIEFADYMKRKMNTVNKRLVFVIGGPYGFSQKVYQAAHEKMSLSKMTFSHQMVRLIFVEQLYRAMNILNGGLITTNNYPFKTLKFGTLFLTTPSLQIVREGSVHPASVSPGFAMQLAGLLPPYTSSLPHLHPATYTPVYSP